MIDDWEDSSDHAKDVTMWALVFKPRAVVYIAGSSLFLINQGVEGIAYGLELNEVVHMCSEYI
ncbi:MAG: hypothetical protein QW348_06570 [Ignisphaera sp.]